MTPRTAESIRTWSPALWDRRLIEAAIVSAWATRPITDGPSILAIALGVLCVRSVTTVVTIISVARPDCEEPSADKYGRRLVGRTTPAPTPGNLPTLIRAARRAPRGDDARLFSPTCRVYADLRPTEAVTIRAVPAQCGA